MIDKELEKKKEINNGKIKDTSAFIIQEAEHLDEISWSNNKFESTYTGEKKDNHKK